jgi:hypothetical protein
MYNHSNLPGLVIQGMTYFFISKFKYVCHSIAMPGKRLRKNNLEIPGLNLLPFHRGRILPKTKVLGKGVIANE